jgi:glyoxylate/hydroxypyruvate reductase A
VAAERLAVCGFSVSGWTRTGREIPGVESFAGDAELDSFLAQSDCLVCLLPLTPQTENILNRDLFAKLPKGASLVNVARGGHLVDADLIEALDSGDLSGATLDVFREEPLPADHPYWTHPKIVITPHIASLAKAESVHSQVAENIRRLYAGEPLMNLVDRARGY